MIVVGREPGEWVADRVGSWFDPNGMAALGWRAADGRITAGTFYRDFNGVSVEATIAADRPLVRTFLWAMFDYPFRQMGARQIVVSVQQGNNRSLNLLARLGFRVAARLPDACPSGDVIIATLRREECRYLELSHGKERITSPNA